MIVGMREGLRVGVHKNRVGGIYSNTQLFAAARRGSS